MKPKTYLYFLILILLLVVLWFINDKADITATNEHPSKTANQPYNEKRGSKFNREINYLEYTAHARCRMSCRHITQAEVIDILKNGTINYRKTDLNDRPCPTYALEGYTRQDNQHVRIVFAQCDKKLKVVTCIDLDNEFACNCK